MLKRKALARGMACALLARVAVGALDEAGVGDVEAGRPGAGAGAAASPPSSRCCSDRGGMETIRYDAGGDQYALCVFDDGSACASWRLLRGECRRGSRATFATFCAEGGGRVDRRDADDGGGEAEDGSLLTRYDVCAYRNGAECDERSYYHGGCDAASLPEVTPASSTYCTLRGGMETTQYEPDGGQYGICIFDDGTACDTWKFVRRECKKGDLPIFSEFCTQNRGQEIQENVDWGHVLGAEPATYSSCAFVNGTSCDEHAYFDEGCQPASSSAVQLRGATEPRTTE
ncbi:hypothetical protein ACHAWF_012532 [Thalassiosira exigua]